VLCHTSPCGAAQLDSSGGCTKGSDLRLALLRTTRIRACGHGVANPCRLSGVAHQCRGSDFPPPSGREVRGSATSGGAEWGRGVAWVSGSRIQDSTFHTPQQLETQRDEPCEPLACTVPVAGKIKPMHSACRLNAACEKVGPTQLDTSDGRALAKRWAQPSLIQATEGLWRKGGPNPA
jgi:hypothetical protein